MKKTQPNPATPPAAAPVSTQPPTLQTALDPMDIQMSNLSPEQEQEVRGALLARLIQQFTDMSTCQIRSIAWYADIEGADHGCDTPAEDFITKLVLHHQVRALTPDDAARRLEEFRENFDSMVECARIFTARYPEATAA